LQENQHRICALLSFSHVADDESIHVVTDEPSRLFWHCRLGHLNFCALADMHKVATGIPKFKQSQGSWQDWSESNGTWSGPAC
jgi:hypothetical protein